MVQGGAAFQQLQKLDNGVSQALQFWGGKQAEANAAKKLADEREGVRKQERLNDLSDDFGDLPELLRTKDNTENDLVEAFSLDLQSKYTETTNQFNEAQEAGNEALARQLKSKADRIIRQAGELNNTLTAVKPVIDDYYKNIDSYNPNDREFHTFTDAIAQRRGFFYIGEDGNSRVLIAKEGTESFDKNKDGKLSAEEKKEAQAFAKKYPDRVTLEDMSLSRIPEILSQGYKAFDIIGEKGLINQAVATLGKVSLEDIEGLKRVKEEGFLIEGLSEEQVAKREEALTNVVEAIIGDPQKLASIVNFGLNEDVDARKTDTEEYKEKAREYLRTSISEAFGHSTSEIYDPSAVSRQNNRDNNARKNRPTSEEQEYGTRKFNINQTINNGVVDLFDGGDFVWKGQELESRGAHIVGDEIVILTNSSYPIRIKQSNATAVNDLYDAFEGTNIPFSETQSVKEHVWRDPRAGKPSRVTDILQGQYNPEGKWIGDDEDLASELSIIYPEAEIKVPRSFNESIKVNGVFIEDIDTKTQNEVEEEISKALGLKKSPEATKTTIKSSDIPTRAAAGNSTEEDYAGDSLFNEGN